jgi:hypothetical protein
MLLQGETEEQHMDNESKATATQDSATPAVAAPATAAAPPLPHRLDDVVKQVKAQLVSGHERRRGSNPYDSLLGRPSHDVWGIRKRA